MSNTSYRNICLVGDTYYYRRKIPVDMALYFPFKRELKRSLKTRNLRNAKHITTMYNAEADKLFTMIRGNTAMNNDEIKKLVNEFTTTILTQNEEHRLDSGHQVTEIDGHLEANIPYSDIAEIINNEILDATFTEIGRMFENYLYEKDIRLDIDRSSTEFKKVLKEVSKGYLSTLNIDQDRDLRACKSNCVTGV